MKMKILWSILFPIGLLTVPFFANAATHAVGINVLNNGTIYMVTTGGQLRPYTSAGAFLSYGFNSWSNVVQANSDDLALPVGTFIPPRDGKIVCSNKGDDKGTCYLITDGQKAAFTSATVFTDLGYSFSNSLSGDVSFLSSAPNISSANQAHSAGTLVNKNGTIYLVGDNGLLGIPDMNTLSSWGYSTSDIVSADTADSANEQSGVMPAYTPGALSPLGNTSLAFGTNPTNPSSTQTPNNTAIVTPTATSTLSAPISTGFEASPSIILSGDSTTFYLHLYNNPTSVTISPGVGNVLGQTEVTVSPTTTTLYTLTASNAAGTISEQSWVTVHTLGGSCNSNGYVWQSDGSCGITPPAPTPPPTPQQLQQQEATRILSAINSEVTTIGSQDTTLINEINACGNYCYQQYNYSTWVSQLSSNKTTLNQLSTILFEVEDYQNSGVLPPASDRAYLLSLGIEW